MTSYATSEVEFPEELAAAVHEHVHSDTENEVGGVFVGTLRDGELEIVDVLPALQAVGGAAHLTFTHETWEHLLSTVDNDYPDEQIVGWYHSHPGHGIFLSTYDQFIHENFFSAPGMVALVVDPRADDDFGWFGWDGDTLTRLGSDLPVDRPDRTAVPTEVSAAAAQRAADEDTMDAVRRGVLIAVAVLAVFSVGTWWGRGSLPEQLSVAESTRATLENNMAVMEQRLEVVCQALPMDAADDDAAPVAPTESELPSPAPEPTTSTPNPSPTATGSPTPAPSPTATTPPGTGEDLVQELAQAVCLQSFPQLQEPVPAPTSSPMTPENSGDPTPSSSATVTEEP